ncbi:MULTISPECIES: AraC family transcriptional regulator [Thiorhodovibrio]|uniref:AraC family transcriptional regulator n=1 Tax=Thiorhodovibrio TaxID=61593 RepID=UPI001912DE96|nr:MULTISPECIES: AraC family transcriptional regulator [Thiorhodovibrio]MBK5968894.1 AraC family transcriptional regulator [Thiorhodovibrio winogradskyi]WPL11967.1 Virulence-regulating protein VirS [Thiorhodovibrio litoralis]WPL12341.1 Virulence-regulating protein VirS [Thiorhodovibrio litoralis]
MSQLTSLYVYKVVGQASPGVDTADLVKQFGLDPEGPIDPTRMVSSAEYYDFFAALAHRDPNGLALPLRIGAAMRSDDYGAFGLAWKSAPNLRGSFVRAERYGHVLGAAETYSLESTCDGLFFNLDKAGDGRLGMLLSNEASLSAVDTISREVSSRAFVPLAVHFKHVPRGDISVYEAHFGCPVYFESRRDALLVSKESLDAPNRLGDETIVGFFDRHLEQQLASLTQESHLELRVRRAVANLLSEGVPTVSSIASELAMSARTLQRRLSEQGHSFQGVVDMARKDLAQRLLAETDYSLAEVAFLTGFADQSGFTRAFKRWAGQTPRSYRFGARTTPAGT